MALSSDRPRFGDDIFAAARDSNPASALWRQNHFWLTYILLREALSYLVPG